MIAKENKKDSITNEILYRKIPVRFEIRSTGLQKLQTRTVKNVVIEQNSFLPFFNLDK